MHGCSVAATRSSATASRSTTTRCPTTCARTRTIRACRQTRCRSCRRTATELAAPSPTNGKGVDHQQAVSGLVGIRELRAQQLLAVFARQRFHLAQLLLDRARAHPGLFDLPTRLVELVLHVFQHVAKLAELGLDGAERAPDLA